MCSLLGGRAAEQVALGDYSTGAQNDLERAYKQANAMVTIYGLSEKVGHVSYYDSSGQNEYAFSKPYSEKTAEIIDDEIKRFVESQYTRAIQILTENQDKLTALANKLLEKEVIFREDLEEIFGKRAWDPELTPTPVTAATQAEEKAEIPQEAIQAPDSASQI